jgi:hypothetical protein
VPFSTAPRTAPKSVHATSLAAPAHAAALAVPDKTARKNARHNIAIAFIEIERPRSVNWTFITYSPSLAQSAFVAAGDSQASALRFSRAAILRIRGGEFEKPDHSTDISEIYQKKKPSQAISRSSPFIDE